MRLFLPSLLCSALVAISAIRPAAATVTVQLQTSVGNMTLELDEDAKPVTVANFLRYVRDGFFGDSFAHRLPQGFVLQGGGYYASADNQILGIPTFPAIPSEKGPFPAYSNVKGTIAMALSGGSNDTATSSWFINLANNDSTSPFNNLDTANGGFTVFGKVVSGLDVLQRFANFKNWAGADGPDLIWDTQHDTTPGNPDNPLANLPVKLITGGQALFENLIYTNWTIIGGKTSGGDPKPVITSPSVIFGNVGTPLSYQTTVTDSDDTTTGSVTTGTLPPGISFDSGTGLISGTPTEIGDTNVVISISNATATGSGPLLFVIDAALPPSLTSVSNSTALPSISTKAKVTGSGGKATLKGSASSGTVKVEVKPGKGGFKKTKGSPASWKFLVKGLKPGKYKFQIRATNANGQTTTTKVQVVIKS